MKVRFPQSRGLRYVSILATLIGLLAIDAAYAGLRFRSTFKSAACDLKRATDGIDDLDMDRATDLLDSAAEEVAAARGYLGHPGLRLVSLVPGLSDDLGALDALSAMAQEAVAAGQSGAGAAREMGLAEGGSLSALYDDGQVRFETLGRGAQAIGDASEDLGDAQGFLDEAPRPSIGQIRSAIAAARRLLGEARTQLADAKVVLDAMPALLGEQTPRRYFLSFQTPSEARGAGGLMGVYGILEIADGRISLEKVAPVRELVPKLKGSVEAEEWFTDLYGNLDALSGWREAGLSPTFPAVAEVWLRMYEKAIGESLDGVIAMDPFVVADLTRGTGPIVGEGLDTEVGPDNAADVLLKDIYVEFERREDEQNAYLRSLVDALWDKLATGEVDGTELIKGMAHAIRTQHLKMYSRTETEQLALERAGLSGDPARHGSNVQMVFHNNLSATKVDYFLERTQSINVVVGEDGSARILTTVQLFNDAPRGELDVLKETDLNELPAGLNRMGLFFMLPEGAVIDQFFTGAVTNTYFDGMEGGVYPIAWKVLEAQVQETIQVAVSYTIEDFVTFKNGRASLRFTVLPQVLVRPDALDVTVSAPSGYRIGPVSGAGSVDPFRFEGQLNSPRTFALRIAAPDVAIDKEAKLSDACN
jgi:hypothetical protein